MKKVLFIREGYKPSNVYGDYGLVAREVNTEVLEGTARKLAELICTTQHIDKLSFLYISSTEESIEEKRKEGKTLSVPERRKDYYEEGIEEGKAVIVWKFDRLGLEETPEEYFKRHGSEIDSMGGKIIGNCWKKIEV